MRPVRTLKFCCQRGQPQGGGQLVNELVGRVLDVQPERLARRNELSYQRGGRIPDDLAAVINPAAHDASPFGRGSLPAVCASQSLFSMILGDITAPEDVTTAPEVAAAG
jgi:hypothetical protein